MKTERTDVYARVTAQIVEAIEKGAGNFRMPWHGDGFTPINVASKREYRGINVLILWLIATKKGYEHGLWGTYRQWQNLGAQVRRGEKSASVVFWKFPDVDDEDEDSAKGERTVNGPFAREYWVFNVAQVEGYRAAIEPRLSEEERIEGAEDFFRRLGADIRHGAGGPHYNWSEDFIHMPPFALFREPVGYYSVLAHEATHWTGAPKRLNRDFGLRFGDHAGAMEELVAELGAAFLCADLALSNAPRPDHAAYISSWLQALKNDKRAIFTAASKAQAAVDWMTTRGEGMEVAA